MPDRAAIIFHITAAPIYSWRITSAYALSEFANTIKLCEHFKPLKHDIWRAE